MNIEETEIQMKKKGFQYSRDKIAKSEEKVSMKLPNLKMTKFEGTAINWFRFWKHFETKIDQVR